MEICIDFTHIKSFDDFYTELGQKMPLPSYFGRNLDALYDTLSGAAELPLRIGFKGLNGFQKRAFSRLIQTMEDLEENVAEFEFIYEK